jgi:transcriptional regulator with XRE-family HTH domain
MPKPLAPIGRAIDARRAELGLSLPQVAEASSVSIEQLRAIRYGANSPRAVTRAAIELALRWEPGSVARVIDENGDPVPLSAATAKTAPRKDRSATVAAIRLVYTGDDEGDEAAIIAAVRRAFPGDDVAVSIVSQDHKTLDQRWTELSGWLRLDTAAQALRNA